MRIRIHRAFFKCNDTRSRLSGWLIRFARNRAIFVLKDSRSILIGKLLRRNGDDVFELGSRTRFVGELSTWTGFIPLHVECIARFVKAFAR